MTDTTSRTHSVNRCTFHHHIPLTCFLSATWAQASQVCYTWLLPKSAWNDDNQGPTLPHNPFRIAGLKQTSSRVEMLSESSQPSICSVLRCQLLTTQSQFWPGVRTDISGKKAEMNILSKEASCHSRNYVPMLVYKRQGFPSGSAVKNPPATQETWQESRFDPWVEKIPWKRKGHAAPVSLPAKFHGQRSQVVGGGGRGADYIPWFHKESDTTEQRHTHSTSNTDCLLAGLFYTPTYACTLTAVSFCRAFFSEQAYYWKNRDLGWGEMGKGEAFTSACCVFITSISCTVPSSGELLSSPSSCHFYYANKW